MGWERANWFADKGQKPETVYSFGRQNWHENVGREMQAVREHVAVTDQSSFLRLLVQGVMPVIFTNYLCVAYIDVPVGTSRSALSMLDERGSMRRI